MKEKTLNQKRAKAIGDVIKRIRHDLKLRQEDMARILPFSKDQISKMESGRRKMNVTDLLTYCEAFQMSPSELVEHIEVILFTKGLLPPPRMLRKTATVKPKVIQVDVSWSGKCFVASLSESLPMSHLKTAPNFQKLQVEVEAFIESYEKLQSSINADRPLWLLYKRYELRYHFIDVKALLKAYMPLVTLAAISRETGISQHRLSLYASGRQSARPDQMQRILSGIQRIAKKLMAIAP